MRPGAREWCIRHWLYGQAARSWNLVHYRRGIALWLAGGFPGFAPEAAQEAENGLRFSHALVANHGYTPRLEMRERRFDQLKTQGWTGLPFNFLRHFRLGGHRDYLHRILDWAEQRGVTPILVDMPVPEDLDEKHFAQEFAQYRAELRAIAEKHGVQVIWADRRDTGLTDADFADLIHLNARGSQRFTAWLRGQLERAPACQGSADAGGRP